MKPPRRPRWLSRKRLKKQILEIHGEAIRNFYGRHIAVSIQDVPVGSILVSDRIGNPAWLNLEEVRNRLERELVDRTTKCS